MLLTVHFYLGAGGDPGINSLVSVEQATLGSNNSLKVLNLLSDWNELKLE